MPSADDIRSLVPGASHAGSFYSSAAPLASSASPINQASLAEFSTGFLQVKTALTLIGFVSQLALALLLSGCGYHVAGHADTLPKTVKTIAVPAFDNVTARYRLTDRIPEVIAREFISRSRYRVVADVKQADAVVHGSVLNYVSYPVVIDQSTGRSTIVQIIVTLDVSLRERQTGKVLYSRPRFEVRARYEIAQGQIQYFEESDIGLERLSQDIGRTVVSAILEAF